MPVGTTRDLIAGRYRMSKRLGAGGMATVFLATDERLERDVAIKRLHADSPSDVGRRFTREAKLGASLNHPNIVAVYDTVTDDEGVLIVMEYVAGHTLRDEIARGPVEPSRAIEILCAVAAALDNAHKHGVVHRDVKPANVLIDDDRDLVKLADLGIAAAAEHTRITQSGAVMGTAAYMAPERLDGGAGNAAVDIYALAAVAFEMLSGRKAVEGNTPLEIARRVATQEPRDLREVIPDAPEGAADALRRGLAKDPSDRPGTAGELIRELSAAYAAQAEGTRGRSRRATAVVPDAPSAAARAERTPRTPAAAAPPLIQRRDRRSRLVPVALALAALLVAVLVIVALASSGGSGDKSASSGNSGSKAKHSQSAKKPNDSKGSAAPQGAGQSQSGGSAAPAPAPSGGGGQGTDASTPAGALSAFYVNAANHDFGAAWKLATPTLQSQVGGYDGFVSQEKTLKSIEFPKLQVTDQSGTTATVSFNSVAHHTTKTDRCTGQAALVKAAGGWKVDRLEAVNCQHGPA